MIVNIKELMKQAGTDSSGKWMGVEHAEKFAELIVRECIAICVSNALDELDSDTRTTSGKSAFDIKEHFGVEE